jgi:uncharacterized membrane protein
MRDRAEEGFVTKTNMERITNGIFAFTMTLLARNIALPAESEIPAGNFLTDLFIRIGPALLDFVVTFLVLAMLWFFLYQIYRNITAIDRPFAYLLMLFLMILVFTPFANQIDNAYLNPSASAILQVTLAILGVICFLLWRHAYRTPGIINPGITRTRIRVQTLKYCVIPVLSAIALAVSFSGAYWGDGVYLLAPVIFFIGFHNSEGDPVGEKPP